MEVLTLYVGQGALAAVRDGNEVVIVDSHMPNSDDVTQDQIEKSLAAFIGIRSVRGLIFTGFDDDHSCPAGVESILSNHDPDWVMYPKYYKETEAATEVFNIVAREVRRREHSRRPLQRISVRVDLVDSRFFRDLAMNFSFELFSPHMEDMDSSNNSSLVVKVVGLGPGGYSYLVTGDTETDRWERINQIFKEALRSDVMAASHHGATSGINAQSLLLVNPNTVLISAGVDNQYGHPDGVAVRAYQRVAEHVYSTNANGEATCLLTRRVGLSFETIPSRHPDPENA